MWVELSIYRHFWIPKGFVIELGTLSPYIATSSDELLWKFLWHFLIFQHLYLTFGAVCSTNSCAVNVVLIGLWGGGKFIVKGCVISNHTLDLFFGCLFLLLTETVFAQVNFCNNNNVFDNHWQKNRWLLDHIHHSKLQSQKKMLLSWKKGLKLVVFSHTNGN